MANEPKLEWGPWEKSSSSEILEDLKTLEEACTPAPEPEDTALYLAHVKKLDEQLGPRCGEIATHVTSHYGPRCELHRVYPAGAANDRPHMLRRDSKCQCRLGRRPVVMQGQATFLEKCRANRKAQVERDHHPDGSIAHTVTVTDPPYSSPLIEQMEAARVPSSGCCYDLRAYDEARKMRLGLGDFVKASVILPDNPGEHVQFIPPKRTMLEVLIKAWQKKVDEMYAGVQTESRNLVPWTPPEPELPKEEPHTYKIRSWTDANPGKKMPATYVFRAAEEVPVGRRLCYYCRQKLAVRFTSGDVPTCDDHKRMS